MSTAELKLKSLLDAEVAKLNDEIQRLIDERDEARRWAAAWKRAAKRSKRRSKAKRRTVDYVLADGEYGEVYVDYE